MVSAWREKMFKEVDLCLVICVLKVQWQSSNRRLTMGVCVTVDLEKYFPRQVCTNFNKAAYSQNTGHDIVPQKSTALVLLASDTHHLWYSREQPAGQALRQSPLHVQNSKSPLRMCNKESACKLFGVCQGFCKQYRNICRHISKLFFIKYLRYLL